MIGRVLGAPHIVRVAAVLEVEPPTKMNQGEAHDWIADHGGNPRPAVQPGPVPTPPVPVRPTCRCRSISVTASTMRRVLEFGNDEALVTPAMIAELRDHAKRTSIGSARLLKGATDKPPGLQSSAVNNWLLGSVQSVDPALIAYVTSRWAECPTDRRTPLTLEMNATLKSEMAQTGIGPSKVLCDAGDLPAGLTYLIVNALATRTTKTVSVEHWDYHMARLAKMPDVSNGRRSRYIQRLRSGTSHKPTLRSCGSIGKEPDLAVPCCSETPLTYPSV